MRLWVALLLALIAQALAVDESCMDRCENGFNSKKSCQCDSMCKYYKSCCSDYEVTCGMKTRGDTFEFAEDDDDLDTTTPSPRRPGHDLSSTLNPHRQGPIWQPPSDFGRRPEQETTLDMIKPQQISDPVVLTESAARTTRSPRVVQPTLQALTTTDAPKTTQAPTIAATTAAPDPDAEICSGRPFDSFMQMKNGSIYAFRGEYFFELDQKSVVPGYPKLIKDLWGISGPIDAAFTRVNCQGKTYMFQGNKYWRFDDGVLEDDFPRDISVGFDKIPDHLEAAFALPAHSHHGKEKVFFFKGDEYYVYEFLHQPSHEECITMSARSPSIPFRRYADGYYNNYERYFSDLFSDWPQHHDKHHFINKDWKGLKSPVDAAMAGRIYVNPLRTMLGRGVFQPDLQWNQQQDQQWNRYQQYGQQWGRRRQNRSPAWGSMAEWGMNMGQDLAERGMEMGMRLAERRMELEERFGRDWMRQWDQDLDQDRRRDGYRRNNNRGNYDPRDDRAFWEFYQRSLPVQTVYFFKGDKYYRVDLSSKRVDPAMPPYPRSIAKYWLGCTDTTGAEKK